MADLAQGIYAAIKAHGGLTALIGSGDDCRAFPVGEVPPDVSLPYVSWQRVSTPREHAMGSDPGLAHPTVQINSWAATFAKVRAVAAQVRDCFQDYTGTVASVVIQRAFIQGEWTMYEPDTQTHHVAQRFEVWHDE